MEIIRRSKGDPGWHEISIMRFTPDGRSLVTFGERNNREIRVSDPRTLKTLRTFKALDQDPKSWDQFPRSLDFTPDGKRLVFGMDYGAIEVYDFDTGKRIRKWQAHQWAQEVRVNVSPDGNTMASLISQSPALKLWDTATRTEKFPHTEGGASIIHRIVVLPDGRTLVSLDRQNRIVHRDLKTERATLKGYWSDVSVPLMWAMCPQTGAVLSPEPKTMGNIAPPAECQLWKDIKKHKHGLAAACFTPDGERVAVYFRGRRYHVYDRRSGKLLKEIGGEIQFQVPLGEGLAFSADRKRIIAWRRGSGQCWDVDAGKRLKALPWRGEWSFTPDRTLAVKTEEDVRLWDLDRGRHMATLIDRSYQPEAIAFSSDGAMMAQSRSGPSGEVVLWELQSHRKIRVLQGARGGATCLAFSPDGGRLYAGTGSSLIVAWDLAWN